jgi:hypothetical protein
VSADQKYARCFAYASRLAAQADRLGVEHAIAPAAPQSYIELSMMENCMREVVRKLSAATGIHPNSGDFIGLVELYGCDRRVAYFR